MTMLDYHALDKARRDYWRDSIATQAWSAAGFLANMLAEERFYSSLGEDAHLLLAVDGDRLMGFCTYAHQDEIPAPELFPWIGFVYVAPEYRGNRLSGSLIDQTCALARRDGHRRVYLSTDHEGLYEKYGFVFCRNMLNYRGNPCRVYTRALYQF